MALSREVRCLVDDLEAGMKLASPVYDLNGKMLLNSNSILSEKHILLLRKMVVAEVEVWDKPRANVITEETKEENPLGLPEIPKFEEIVPSNEEQIGLWEAYWNEEKQVAISSAYVALLTKMKKVYSLARLYGDIDQNVLEGLVEEILAFSTYPRNLLRCVFFHPRQSPYIFHHSLHVTLFSILIARQSNFPNERLRKLALAALLHDVGKIRVSLEVLGKKEPLTEVEQEKVRLHALLGFRFLQQQKKFDMPILMGVLQHHERLDGSGYPLQTHSEKTHVFARIIAIADVYDAMTSQKNYGVQHSPFDALAEIRRDISSGRIDANYGRAFLEIMRTNLLGEWVALSDGRFCQLVGWGQDEKRMLYLQSVDNERIVLVGDSLIKPIQIIPPQSGNVFL